MAAIEELNKGAIEEGFKNWEEIRYGSLPKHKRARNKIYARIKNGKYTIPEITYKKGQGETKQFFERNPQAKTEFANLVTEGADDKALADVLKKHGYKGRYGPVVQKTANSFKRRFFKDEMDSFFNKIKEILGIKGKLNRNDKGGIQRTLNVLEKGQYINPQTKKVYSPTEWMKLNYDQRHRIVKPERYEKQKTQRVIRRKEQMKDPAFRKQMHFKQKKHYYLKGREYERKRAKTHPQLEVRTPGKRVLKEQWNRLLNYMALAAAKQKKALKGKKEIPQYQDIIKEGKFRGIKDNKTGIHWYEAGFNTDKIPGKGLDKKHQLIVNHREYDNLGKLMKLADKFKRAMPNEAIASYFTAYERVPTMGELGNFLTQDPDWVMKMTPTELAKNPLNIHHILGMEIEPTKNLQFALQDANKLSGAIEKSYKNRWITKEEAVTRLKELNIRTKLPGTSEYVGAVVDPGYGVGAAKRRINKLFYERLKTNPNLVQDIASRFGGLVKDGAAGGPVCGLAIVRNVAVGKAPGGVIGPDCSAQVKQVIQENPDQLVKEAAEAKVKPGESTGFRNIARQILNKIPKGGRLGAILAGAGAVGLGAGALFGGSEAKAEEVFQEPGTTELEAQDIHDR